MRKTDGKYMAEERFEKELVHHLRQAGLWAHHTDAAIHGFPDILVLYRNKACTIEVKSKSRGDMIHSLVEPSQPVFAESLKACACTHQYLAVCSDDSFDIYPMPTITEILKGEACTLADLGLICSGPPSSVASFFLGLMEVPA